MPSNNSRTQRDKRQFDAEIRNEERGERSAAEQIAALDARVNPNGARKERTRLTNIVLADAVATVKRSRKRK